MEDDWDDGTESTPVLSNVGVASTGGRQFSKGRGYKPVESSNDDWGSGGGGDYESNKPRGGWNDRGNRRGGRGGSDFGGERRGRGGGNIYRENNGNSNGWSKNDEDDEWGASRGSDSHGNNDGGHFEGRGRGRGGRGGRGRGGGGGRNGDGERNDERGDDKEEPQRPKEIYVPVERTTDDNIFATTITSGVNFIKLDEIEVNVSGEDIPTPITSFESSGLRPHILGNVLKSGYTKPTPIQKYALPIVMKGRDLMGCAQTGSGKTAAFLLPIINSLLASQEPPVMEESTCQPRCVIVSPTRELAIQIFEQSKKFAHNTIIKTVVAYGGTSVNHQRTILANGCHILVATPGRLNDFVKRGHLNFASCGYFVLDEADRMLDMGFLPTVEEMLGHATMPSTGERQTLMFSATFPEDIQHLAGKFLFNYIFVTVGIVGSASTDVEQNIYQVTKFDKREKLISMLQKNNEKTVVFVETKKIADFLATVLSENDIKTTSIHGDRLQREREEALWDFKKGICKILVATGVAARGLDIEGVQHVINYDLPKSIDEYVHRIGRTGRVGNRGKATSFFDSSHDMGLAAQLAVILKQAGQEVPDWLGSVGHHSGSSDNFGGRDIRGGDFGRAQNFSTIPAEEPEEEW